MHKHDLTSYRVHLRVFYTEKGTCAWNQRTWVCHLPDCSGDSPSEVALITAPPSSANSPASSKPMTLRLTKLTPLSSNCDFNHNRYTSGFTEYVSNSTPHLALGGRG